MPDETIQTVKPVSSIKFGEIFKEAFRLYKTNFVGLTGVFLIPLLVAEAVNYFLSGSPVGTLGNWEIPLVIGVALVLWGCGILETLSVLRGSVLTDKGQFGFSETLSFAFAKFIRAMGLSVRIFIYTGAWAVFLVGIISFAGMLPGIIGLSATKDFEGMIRFLLPAAIFGPIVMIVLILILMKRFMSVTFAFAILASNDDISSREALMKSIELSDKKTGTIFSNYFLYGLVVVIISIIVSQIFAQIAGAEYIGTVISDIFLGVLGSVFQYAFLKKMKEEKGL